MEPPKCKICGERHWASQPHHLHESVPANIIVAAPAEKKDTKPKPSPPKPKLSAKFTHAKLMRLAEVKIEAEIKKRGRPITVNTPRAEYQRDLMRKRRAKTDG